MKEQIVKLSGNRLGVFEYFKGIAPGFQQLVNERDEQAFEANYKQNGQARRDIAKARMDELNATKISTTAMIRPVKIWNADPPVTEQYPSATLTTITAMDIELLAEAFKKARKEMKVTMLLSEWNNEE